MITGDKIILRPPLDSDLPVLLEMRNNLELQNQLLATPRPNTITRVKQWLERRLDDERTIFFIIAEKTQHHPTGFIQLVDINFTHRTSKLGIALHPSAQGQGYGQEAITLCEHYAVSLHQLRKVELQVLASNTPAIKLYTKLSYRTVGTLAQHYYSHNQYHDVTIMEKILQQTLP